MSLKPVFGLTLPTVLRLITLISVVCLIALSACKKDTFTTNSSDSISFSTDTLFFDTVFTTVGSSTRKFKIFNEHNESIKISSIKLANGSNSLFRLNVNGVPGTEFKDLEIRAKDSMWVFADVTVDPQNTNIPFVVTDSIEFSTNGNFQDIQLVAFGQNAIFHKSSTGSTSFLVDCNDVWDNTKPHVVYGIAVIDTNCSLTIDKGTHVYFHNNGAIIALNSGSLKIQGTKDEPVVLEGDRLEPQYDNIAGQWQGIYLFPLSIDNEVDWAIIKNSRLGIQADTVNQALSSNPTLTIRNSKIYNCSSIGISGRGSWIEGSNCAFVNCGDYCGAFSLGGTYNFKHCTFANYSPNGIDQAALVLNNWFEDNDRNIIPRDLDAANFTNCIIYGSQFNEITLSKVDEGTFNYHFKNCLIKAEKSDVDYETSEFENCTVNEDPDFVDQNDHNVNLGENSAAKDIGDLTEVNNDSGNLEKDLNDNSRTDDSKPDAGAFEFIPGE